MSIGKDVTSKRTKFKPEKFENEEEKRQEAEADREEQRLETANKEPKLAKEIRGNVPLDMPKEPADHFGVLVDAGKSQVLVAGGKHKRKRQ
jgi:hypothetical protein